MIKEYGIGKEYRKRTPSMYAFYHRELLDAQHRDDEKKVEEILADLPKEIYLALERAGVIETSVESSRETSNEKIVRATLIVLLEKDILKQWPSNTEIPFIVADTLELLDKR
jgi:hypothetical protein